MIQVFVTGGTFDKQYNYITGELFFQETHLKEMLERGRCSLDVEIKTLMMLDSLEMTDIHRDIIIKNCAESRFEKIIVTHGTDRMVETAISLAAAKLPKSIVLTGAMIPYAFGTSSDGFFNLGAALAFAQVLPHGVYVAMNGRWFDWDKVAKNRSTGLFEAR
ncbi:MAG: asparaginase domain-containing protein [Saprospiraceae bacterium]